MDQLAEKHSLVEQLRKTESELQLEVDKLRAQNLLLRTHTGDKSHSTLHVHATEIEFISEASLHGTTVISVMGNLVLDGSPPNGAQGEVGHRESAAHPSWPVSQVVTPYRKPITQTMRDLRIVSGLNVSAAPFGVHRRTSTQGGCPAENVPAWPGGYNPALQSHSPHNVYPVGWW